MSTESQTLTPQEDSKQDVYIYGHRGASQWLEDHGWLLSHRTLMNMVCLQNGPPVHKWGGRVVYIESELADWANSRWR